MIAVLCMGTVFTGCDKSGGDTDTSSESRTKRDLFELTIMDDMPDIFADFLMRTEHTSHPKKLLHR